MGFLTAVEHLFDAGDLKHGRILRASGRVKNVQATATSAQADIIDGQRFVAELDWERAEEGIVFCGCGCARFEHYATCKHIVALCCELDQRGLGAPERVLIHELVPMGESTLAESSDVEYSPAFSSQMREMAGKLPPHAAHALGLPRTGGAFGLSPLSRKGPAPPPLPAWKQRLLPLRQPNEVTYSAVPAPPPPRARELAFLIFADQESEDLELNVYCREEKKTGGFGKFKELKVGPDMLHEIIDPVDRETLAMLRGGGTRAENNSYYYRYQSEKDTSTFVLTPAMYDVLLSRLSQRGQLRWLSESSENAAASRALRWDGGEPFEFRVAVEPRGTGWRITGVIERGAERREVDQIEIPAAELAIFDDRLEQVRIAQPDDLDWMHHFMEHGPLLLSAQEAEPFRRWLQEFSVLPKLAAPPEFKWQERSVTPHPHLTVIPAKYDPQTMVGSIAFDYDGHRIEQQRGAPGQFADAAGAIVRRNWTEERKRLGELDAAGFHQQRSYGMVANTWHIPAKRLHDAVPELIAAGWRVVAEGMKFRSSGDFRASLVSGVDWFDLEGSFDFEGVSVELPALLAAVRKGEKFIELGDGTRGVLPADWLARYGRLIDLGEQVEGKVRFRSSQALLLDALLAAQPQVALDERFREIRDRLQRFDGIKPREEPGSFQGELRPYQREGLGWLAFLEEYQLGGCLADDMGLGKTIQVLAHLEQRRAATKKKAERRPSLVVVPKSLVHNWKSEAARFTPKLKVLDYTGTERKSASKGLEEYDLVVSTYGTIRNDVVKLKEIDFDYVILDEAQAVKNNTSQAAKAVRLLQGRNRLAMSGTPIENHLGELWSLFEFLNPGMLGRAEAFKRVSGSMKDEDSRSQLGLLAQALRPFFLRRTKDKVLAELPEKTEQVLMCDLGDEERKLYNELRDHYRALLDHRIATDGLAKSKIHVLEALLRLRQAACHPGLLDPERAKLGSAKLDMLFEQLREVIDEGHKALVFSQFTSLLALVEPRLREEKIPFAYLDGKTNNRGEVVAEFQNNAECPVFLLSLKAGGVGLNLTAADYVFILDPWWNPAVEAQAIDRAHRIGQTQHVFAYRLIARDTVEEKIVALQKDKRDLAEAILSADNSLIASLTADDLQLLLS